MRLKLCFKGTIATNLSLDKSGMDGKSKNRIEPLMILNFCCSLVFNLVNASMVFLRNGDKLSLWPRACLLVSNWMAVYSCRFFIFAQPDLETQQEILPTCFDFYLGISQNVSTTL